MYILFLRQKINVPITYTALYYYNYITSRTVEQIPFLSLIVRIKNFLEVYIIKSVLYDKYRLIWKIYFLDYFSNNHLFIYQYETLFKIKYLVYANEREII